MLDVFYFDQFKLGIDPDREWMADEIVLADFQGQEVKVIRLENLHFCQVWHNWYENWELSKKEVYFERCECCEKLIPRDIETSGGWQHKDFNVAVEFKKGKWMCLRCIDYARSLDPRSESPTGKPKDPSIRQRKKLTAKERHEIYDRDGYACRYCGKRTHGLSLDHVIPFGRGGECTKENLVTCCKSCNSKKRSRTPEEAGMTLRELA